MTRSTNARLAGFTFLLYIAIGITQMVLSRPLATNGGTAAKLALIAAHVPLMRIDILLTLFTCVIALTLAAALYGLTREVDPDLAVLAFSCRVGEGLFAAIAPLTSLALIWLATTGAGTDAPPPLAANALGSYLEKVGQWNAAVCAILFAFGSTLFCWLLLRGRMIPGVLAWLGLVASILLVVGLPLRLVGILPASLALFLWLPMAAFEIPLGFWLLAKGVRAPVTA